MEFVFDNLEVEEEFLNAIETAKKEIEHLVSLGYLEHGEEWWNAWSEHDLKWSDSEPSYVTIPEEKISPLLSKARRMGEVFELVLFVSQTRLDADEKIPAPIRELTSRYLKGELEKPVRKSGRKKEWGRDFIIINVMHRLFEELDILHTVTLTNAPTKKFRAFSASMVVAEAIQQTTIGIVTLKQIQKIWGEDGEGKKKNKRKDHDDAYRGYLTSLLDDETDLSDGSKDCTPNRI